MLLVRRVAAVICFVVLTAADSSAFKVNIHEEVTREALRDFPAKSLTNLISSVPVDRREGFQEGFSTIAIQEIVNGNLATDAGDCGKLGADAPATPCEVGGVGGSAVVQLMANAAPAVEHFDDEKIQEGSNRIFNGRTTIRNYILQRNFVGARRVLGNMLHSIQDFYAHSNWVELGNRDFERRLGTKLNAFSDGSIPRIAAAGEPTCVAGMRLLTDLSPMQWTTLLAKYDDAKGTTGRITGDVLRKVRQDRPLTSGHWFVWGNPSELPLSMSDLDILAWGWDALWKARVEADLSVITDDGKCRHGYSFPKVNQPGINKDESSRRGFDNARTLAWGHSINFITSIFNDDALRKTGPDYPDLMLGFMGHGTKSVDIEGFTIGVPGAPNNDSWDTAIGSVLKFFVMGTQGLKNIQPDIYVCLESGNVPGTCAPVCDDADWSNDTNPPAYICSQALNVRSESDVRVLVREVDFGQPRRVIANFRVEDVTTCNSTYTSATNTAPAAVSPGAFPTATPTGGACMLELEPGRTVWIQFQTRAVPQRAAAPPTSASPTTASQTPTPITPAAPIGPATLPPIADPPPIGPPPASPPDPRAPSTTLPLTTPTSGDPGPLPPAPTPPLPPATTPGPGGGGTSPNRLPTAEEIDAALGLRDADNCVGNDMFFPPGTVLATSPLGQQLGQVQTSRLYQASAFAMAISDPTVKQTVLNAIRAKVGDDAFFGVMTLMLGDAQQSQALVAAHQATANYIVQRIVSQRLNTLLPLKPPTVLAADVDRWIFKRLASGPLVSTAVDMMFAASPTITAECTLNELAKEGFTDTVYRR